MDVVGILLLLILLTIFTIVLSIVVSIIIRELYEWLKYITEPKRIKRRIRKKSRKNLKHICNIIKQYEENILQMAIRKDDYDYHSYEHYDYELKIEYFDNKKIVHKEIIPFQREFIKYKFGMEQEYEIDKENAILYVRYEDKGSIETGEWLYYEYRKKKGI